jgi:iodotyrosine deiodinase
MSDNGQSAASMRPLDFEYRSTEEMQQRAQSFKQLMQQRRTVRDFASTPVPASVIEDAIATAASAPSGANRQPWHFAAVQSAEVKRKIRIAAEQEENEFYSHRASDDWLEALKPFATDAQKPFLETAPWLIAVFARKFTINEAGEKLKHYYTPESVGIATGLLIASLHNAGLATLTHTPSPMGFLKELLGRPPQDRAFLLLVAGYPAEDAVVPDIEKLPLKEVMSRW